MDDQSIGLTVYVSPDDERELVRRTMYRVDESVKASIVATYAPAWPVEELARFRDDGYVAMEGIFSTDEVEDAKGAVSDLAHRRTSNDLVTFQEEPFYASGGYDERVDDPELRVRSMRNFCQAEPRLASIVDHPRLRGLVDGLLGARHVLLQETALLKPAFRGAEKPWHQDSAYFDYQPLDEIIGVWIALDPATVDNGCMQIVPGSHRNGPARHYHIRDCQIEDALVAVDRAVVVPLKPGGALFFSALLHHGTPPNASPDRRRALQFHFMSARCQQMTFDEHAALFDDGGAYAGCRDWELPPGQLRAHTQRT
jgi:phytanoyl-CoA hydroxylase